ncbi:hypothetical protein SDJN03_01602, partial [Cucurbita argyrosperma subsp. sororia]
MANLHKSKSDYDDLRRHRRCCCCKRHPKHRQSPGVCSLCLTEKLSQILTATTSSRKISDSLSSSSSDSSSYYSSVSSCSSCSSPNRLYDKATASSMYKKSRSMAFASRFRRGTDSDSGKKSHLGFWSRFLNRPRRKRMELDEALMHSRSSAVVQGNVHG